MAKENEMQVRELLHHMGLAENMSDIYSKVDGLSLQNLFFCKNKYFPYCDMFTQDREDSESYFDTKELLERFKKVYGNEKFYTVVYRNINLSNKEIHIGFSIILEERNIFARFEKNISESYILYGEGDEEKVKEFEDLVLEYYKEPKKKEDNIRMIKTTQAGFDFDDFEFEPVDVDIDKQYNDDFKKEADKIDAFIKSDRSGIVILHGEKGTGKSTYINSLIQNNQDKQFVYFPSMLVRLLSEPSFTNFLPRLKNTTLILEDCEDAIKSRNEAGSNSPVNVLLNLADGLLKSLKMKFICTFNADVNEIDDALLRKGRLVSKYELKKLSKEKTEALLSEIYGREMKVDGPMSLADIYNFEEDSYEEVEKRKIGFNA